MSDRIPQLGESVIYCDPSGVDHDALFTAVWGDTPDACCNVVFVSHDDSKTDSYGRQIERETSVEHVSKSTVHGRYWRYADEPRNAFAAPTQK